ncbi:hypothetical protein [Streptomyces hyaluromycini]|uniref:hypothetical protein n=1 Tax=Streptomyces hyaluromycini TaxID=1377993 RepID=UPI0011AE469B|nr:hypothetical protein [Streptomyces hyaluromycini]
MMKVRNSEDYGALVSIASDDRFPWSVCVMAGRGISAYASANDWVLAAGKKIGEAHLLGEQLISLAEITEGLGLLWDKWTRGDISIELLKSELEDLVFAMERWIEGVRPAS